MAEEENLILEEGGLSERGNRRARKEEPKLSDVRICCCVFFSLLEKNTFFSYIYFVSFLLQGEPSPTTASIPELERQIDRLSKVSLMLHRRSSLYIYFALY